MKWLFLLLLIGSSSVAAGQTRTKGILLEDLTWLEAEKVLTAETVVLIPLGAANCSVQEGTNEGT